MLHMIGCAAGADAPSAHALDNLFVLDLNVQNHVDPNAHLVQCFRLRDRAREAVQNEAVFARVGGKIFLDDADHDFIRN